MEALAFLAEPAEGDFPDEPPPETDGNSEAPESRREATEAFERGERSGALERGDAVPRSEVDWNFYEGEFHDEEFFRRRD